MARLDLRNLTADDKALLEQIGVTTNAQFEKLGAEKAHLLILELDTPVDHDLIYRLRGAERDIDWKIVADKTRRHARSRFADVDEP